MYVCMYEQADLCTLYGSQRITHALLKQAYHLMVSNRAHRSTTL